MIPDNRAATDPGWAGGRAESPGGGAILRARLLIGLVTLATLVLLVAHLGELEGFTDLARTARPAWLILAVALQALTYAAEAFVWRAALAWRRFRQPFRDLYALSIVELLTNQALPTLGIAGPLLVVRALIRRGVPRSVAAGAILLDFIGYYAAYGVAAACGLALIWAHRDLPPLALTLAGAVLALGLGVAAAARWLTTPGRKLPRWARRWRALEDLSAADPALVREPRLLLTAAALRLANFALDALTLWACLRAVGQRGAAGAAAAAFVLASLARSFGFVPGGLGTFEAASVAGLALFGVAVEAGLTATLLLRGLSFWLPMLPGLWLARRLAVPSPGGR